MADKKMTQVQALEAAIEVLDDPTGFEEMVDVVAVLKHMVEKRKAEKDNRKPRVNKEAVAFRENIVEVLKEAENPMTNAELAEHFGVNPQRISNNIHVLEDAGIVKRIRGEKSKDKDTFTLA